jgi:hypothetical protein
MGNNQPKTEFQKMKIDHSETGKYRINQFLMSSRVPLRTKVDKTGRLDNYLSRGDILIRKTAGGSTSNSDSTSVAQFNGRYDHYAIYLRHINHDQHRLIEKTDQKTGNCIMEIDVSTDVLKDYYSIVVDCRYDETADMALFVMNNNIDAGYSSTVANCEHFVTFCLSRNTGLCVSSQASPIETTRSAVGTVSSAVGNVGKFITHPFYMIGGDMVLAERTVKTLIPFGFDAENIANGKLIMIGCPNRNIWHYWCEFSKKPSFKSLHQCEVDNPSHDNRIMRWHR